MDQRERFEQYEEAIRVALQGMQTSLWTAMPAIVQSFDAGKQTAKVQPVLKLKQYTDDTTTVDYQLPLLLDVPVQFPMGGVFAFTFPIAEGDECLVVFASRSIDTWFHSGQISVQTDMRMHSLSDGFALMGFRSNPRAIVDYNTDSARLRLVDNSAYMELTDAGVVNILAPGGFNVNAADHIAMTTTGDAAITAATLTETITTKTTLTSPIVSITGVVQIAGSVAATAGIRALVTPVVFTGGIGLSTHNHTQGKDSAGNTEVPTSTAQG